MKENDSDHDPVAKLVKNGLVQMPFSDFEERMMNYIQNERKLAAGSVRDRTISLLFFILGCFFGLLIATLVLVSGQSLVGLSADQTRLVFQVGLVLIALFMAERVRTLVRTRKQLLHE